MDYYLFSHFDSSTCQDAPNTVYLKSENSCSTFDDWVVYSQACNSSQTSIPCCVKYGNGYEYGQTYTDPSQLADNLPSSMNNNHYCVLSSLDSTSLGGYKYIYILQNSVCGENLFTCSNGMLSVYDTNCSSVPETFDFSMGNLQSKVIGNFTGEYDYFTLGSYNFNPPPSILLSTSWNSFGGYTFMFDILLSLLVFATTVIFTIKYRYGTFLLVLMNISALGLSSWTIANYLCWVDFIDYSGLQVSTTVLPLSFGICTISHIWISSRMLFSVFSISIWNRAGLACTFIVLYILFSKLGLCIGITWMWILICVYWSLGASFKITLLLSINYSGLMAKAKYLYSKDKLLVWLYCCQIACLPIYLVIAEFDVFVDTANQSGLVYPDPYETLFIVYSFAVSNFINESTLKLLQTLSGKRKVHDQVVEYNIE
ncbi:hypothetical protein HDV04_004713 [Boothiomyces sp. JEL0838]|nr:hypothetical protein HDV04_004713 [Boothiomyces sp. JEL0838]